MVAEEARLHVLPMNLAILGIVLGSKISGMPRHPAKEIKTGTLQAIL